MEKLLVQPSRSLALFVSQDGTEDARHASATKPPLRVTLSHRATGAASYQLRGLTLASSEPAYDAMTGLSHVFYMHFRVVVPEVALTQGDAAPPPAAVTLGIPSAAKALATKVTFRWCRRAGGALSYTAASEPVEVALAPLLASSVVSPARPRSGGAAPVVPGAWEPASVPQTPVGVAVPDAGPPRRSSHPLLRGGYAMASASHASAAAAAAPTLPLSPRRAPAPPPPYRYPSAAPTTPPHARAAAVRGEIASPVRSPASGGRAVGVWGSAQKAQPAPRSAPSAVPVSEESAPTTPTRVLLPSSSADEWDGSGRRTLPGTPKTRPGPPSQRARYDSPLLSRYVKRSPHLCPATPPRRAAYDSPVRARRGCAAAALCPSSPALLRPVGHCVPPARTASPLPRTKQRSRSDGGGAAATPVFDAAAAAPAAEAHPVPAPRTYAPPTRCPAGIKTPAAAVPLSNVTNATYRGAMRPLGVPLATPVPSAWGPPVRRVKSPAPAPAPAPAPSRTRSSSEDSAVGWMDRGRDRPTSPPTRPGPRPGSPRRVAPPPHTLNPTAGGIWAAREAPAPEPAALDVHTSLARPPSPLPSMAAQAVAAIDTVPPPPVHAGSGAPVACAKFEPKCTSPKRPKRIHEARKAAVPMTSAVAVKRAKQADVEAAVQVREDSPTDESSQAEATSPTPSGSGTEGTPATSATPSTDDESPRGEGGAGVNYAAVAQAWAAQKAAPKKGSTALLHARLKDKKQQRKGGGRAAASTPAPAPTPAAGAAASAAAHYANFLLPAARWRTDAALDRALLSDAYWNGHQGRGQLCSAQAVQLLRHLIPKEQRRLGVEYRRNLARWQRTPRVAPAPVPRPTASCRLPWNVLLEVVRYVQHPDLICCADVSGAWRAVVLAAAKTHVRCETKPLPLLAPGKASAARNQLLTKPRFLSPGYY
eukprot:TRINITY_DN7269_c0_g2_i1.p1 TRINITY_DN7269_c0_g2~~TRINITY_DN7269_c0_g2_i1.p1  ORF type:complete len:1056 (+),score=246.03 TRINITY_DN7269_c0_g2_i1:374-3169(+)